MRANHIIPNDCVIDGDVAYLILTDKQHQPIAAALIDSEDAARVLAAGRWSLSGHYVRARIAGCRILLHRFVRDAADDRDVDHVNHNTLDCRKANLRECTHTQNMMNRKGAHRHSGSGVRNVQWDAQKRKWRVRVRANGITHSFGRYDSLEEATTVAEQARRRLHGNFAA